MQQLRRRLPVLTFWIAVALMLAARIGASLYGGQVLTGYDALDWYAPWSTLPTAGDGYEGNPYITDQIDSQIPLLVEYRERIAQGDWPLQSNLAQGGRDGMVTPSHGFLTPTRFVWLLLPLVIAAGWAKLLEIGFAIGFTYLFARRLGMGRFASSVSGFAFAFSGFIIAWGGWAQATVVALLPMLFWAVERFVQDRRWRNLVPVALASAFLLLAGFPVVAGHSFVVAGLYAVIRCFVTASGEDARPLWHRIRALLQLGLGVVVGALISMVQLLPFVELTLLGSSLEYRDGWSSIQDPPTTWLSVFLSVPPQAGGAAYQDHAAYVGAVAFLLAAIGVLAYIRGALPKGVGALFIVVCVFAVAFISFQGFLGWGKLVNGLPLLDDNPPGRLRAQLALPVAIFVGLGVQWLLNVSPRGQWRGPAWLKPGFAWPAAAVATLAFIATFVPLAVYGKRAGVMNNPELRNDLLLVFIPLSIVLLGFLIAWFVPRMRIVAVTVASVAIVVQAMGPTAFFWPTSDADEVLPESETMDFLAENVGHDQLGTAGLVMRPNIPNAYGIRLVNGHGFVTEPWRAALKEADETTFTSGGTYSYFQPSRTTLFENAALDRLGVRYVAAAADEYFYQVGVPVPLVGEIDKESSGEGGSTETLTESGERVEFEVESEHVNGAVVPMTLAGDVVVEASAFDEAGNEIATNLLYFSSPGTEIDLPVGLAIPEGETVASIEVAVTPEPSDDGLAEVEIHRTAEGDMVAWSNSISGEQLEYPLVYAGENVLVWERETALSRIRLATEADGDDELPADRGTVEIRHDDGDLIQATTDADTASYFTVAQSLEVGYHATVDGEAVEIEQGADGLYVVPVPAGQHEVEIVFMPRSVPIGLALTIVGVVALLGMLIAGPVRDRLRARHEHEGKAP